MASLSGLDDLVQDSEQGEVRMWFPSMSIFSHSCSPNTEALARTKHGLALSATRVSRVMMMMMMMMMMIVMITEDQGWRGADSGLHESVGEWCGQETGPGEELVLRVQV